MYGRKVLIVLSFIVGLWAVEQCTGPTCGPPVVHIGRCETAPLPTEDWSRFPNVSNIPHLLLYGGMSLPVQPSIIYLCWNESYLFVKFENTDNNIYNPFYNCNDDLYKYDVNEFFVTPLGTVANTITNYIELEVSPTGALFAANVYNPRDTCTGIQDSLIPCAATGIGYQAGKINGGWYSYLQVPWKLIDGVSMDEKSVTGYPSQNVYRGNFFRIDTPQGGEKELECWSPTFIACFHVPSDFGWLHLTGY
eukprot:TRINITY_DN20115_c0_g1_i1.p1 TRINITY_DN20115_c0_g1~~TRINITY_DN20115_c0_g1_i1.p1  ORF type:complete len:250 (+),score=34.64 TRINITY_DN20115_c0_g1_i1:70-819(+)